MLWTPAYPKSKRTSDWRIAYLKLGEELAVVRELHGFLKIEFALWLQDRDNLLVGRSCLRARKLLQFFVLEGEGLVLRRNRVETIWDLI
jgi:hypothetical protein